MKKREFFLFLSFVALFVLFAIFQNFSFPTKQLQQISNKKFFQERLHKFVPTYTFNDYIGGDIEAPYGYKEEINRRIASVGQQVVFDQKRFLKDGVKTLPIYKEVKDMLDVSSDAASAPPCIENPVESQNNCHVEYAPPPPETSSVSSEDVNTSLKFKANPLRQTASISVSGNIESRMVYNRESGAVNVQFKKDLDENADIQLKLDSEEKSGSVNIDLRW